jgi:gliding motility-associated-like protein
VNSSPLILTDPPVFILDSVLQEDISCNGAGDGSLEIRVSGGIGPYEYSIDNQASWLPDSVFSALTPGTYEVYSRDANLCGIYAGAYTLAEPPALDLIFLTTDISGCAGDTTGIIEAIGSGGSGPLVYSLDGLNFQDSGIFTNLATGDYTVFLRDSGGCSITGPVTLNEPEAVSAVIDKTNATFGNLGSISFTSTSGGIPPYEYTIDGPGGIFSSQTFYGDLNAGTYDAIVRDANGCSYREIVDILDVEPLDVNLTLADLLCNGAGDGSILFEPLDAEGPVEFSIDSGVTYQPGPEFPDLEPGTYYLVARDSIGKVFTDSVILNEPPAINMNWTTTPAECNAFSETGAINLSISGGTGAFTFQWSDGPTDEDRSGILAGIYVVEATDENNCMLSDTIMVASLVIVDAYAGEDSTICYGSSVELFGTGGHTPSWSPVDFLSDPDVANPVAGQVTATTTYVLTISEEMSPYGCFNTDSVTLTVLPLTGLEVSEDTFVVRGNSVPLEAVGGPFSAYRWEPATGLDNSTIPNPVATPQETTLYTAYATNENGCEESDSVLVEVIEDIRAYNVFTPGGDGFNDYFEIEGAERFPGILVEVYSRWGDLLYSQRGYDEGNLWDGTSGGRNVPMGTYYYVIIPYDGAAPITGTVTVIWGNEEN